MLGMVLAMALVVIVGFVALIWAVFVEREFVMVLPGLMLTVVGLVFGGIAMEDYLEYGTFAEAKKARAQRYVRCECGAPLRCDECRDAEKTVAEEAQ